ncbi:MAG: hypothetical protein D6762_00085 [Candidatus Neomarinimicrobiota bacterium]|nr:MAG: hypothetical protein D6762_00085 [Candidatus Neomarinimicrobiota bacterium]
MCRVLTLFLLGCALVTGQDEDSWSPVNPGPFLKTIKMIHHAPDIMFQGRPYDLELFVDFPEDSIESVLIHIKTDSMYTYLEIPLKKNRDHYLYRFNPRWFKGQHIQYFFTVQLSNFKIFATPMDEVGNIKPIRRTLIDPVQYWEWRKRQYGRS